MIRNIGLLLFYIFSISVSADECKNWFTNIQIKKGESCLVECTSADVDMGTFHCPNLCDKLCKKPMKKQFLFKISRLYFTLTPLERALSIKYPKKMLKAYQLSWKANNLCQSILWSSDRNDESDACRHFVWAALLYQQFDLNFSEQILKAHEQNAMQPKQEKSMDLTNNRLGLSVAKKLSKENKLNKDEIIKSFKKNVKNGQISVLKPKLLPSK